MERLATSRRCHGRQVLRRIEIEAQTPLGAHAHGVAVRAQSIHVAREAVGPEGEAEASACGKQQRIGSAAGAIGGNGSAHIERCGARHGS